MNEFWKDAKRICVTMRAKREYDRVLVASNAEDVEVFNAIMAAIPNLPSLIIEMTHTTNEQAACTPKQYFEYVLVPFMQTLILAKDAKRLTHEQVAVWLRRAFYKNAGNELVVFGKSVPMQVLGDDEFYTVLSREVFKWLRSIGATPPKKNDNVFISLIEF